MRPFVCPVVDDVVAMAYGLEFQHVAGRHLLRNCIQVNDFIMFGKSVLWSTGQSIRLYQQLQ